jgi:preprotein translocase subunit SecB
MKIQLKEWKTKNLTFKIEETKKESEDVANAFNLSIGDFYPEASKNRFGIGFKVHLTDDEFILDVEMIFLFELDSEIDENFKQSDFPKINAPAIAFPYIRSYISNFTLQSGFAPIMLPSINFVELARDNKAENT